MHCDRALGCYGLLTAGERGVSCLPAVVDFGEHKTQLLEHCRAATEGQTALRGALSLASSPSSIPASLHLQRRECVSVQHMQKRPAGVACGSEKGGDEVTVWPEL